MIDWRRSALFIILFSVLAWSLIAFGNVEDVPTDSIRDQETTAIIRDPGAHVGEQVVIDGTVIGTNPLRVRLESGNGYNIQLNGVSGSAASVGDQLYAFGTLTGPNTLRADRIVRQEPWERTYILLVSAIGGSILLARLLYHWRFNVHRLVFVPRTENVSSDNTDD